MCRPGQLAVTVTAMYVGNGNWVGSGERALLPLAPVSQIRYKGIKLNQYKSIQLKKTTKASDQVRQALVPSLVTCTACTVCLTPKEGVGVGVGVGRPSALCTTCGRLLVTGHVNLSGGWSQLGMVC